MVKSCGVVVVVVVGGGPRDYTVSFLGLAIAIPISRPRPRSLTILKQVPLSRQRVSTDPCGDGGTMRGVRLGSEDGPM